MASRPGETSHLGTGQAGMGRRVDAGLASVCDGNEDAQVTKGREALVGTDQGLVERLVQRAYQLAGQRTTSATGELLWYDNILATFKEAVGGAQQAEKARQLVHLAAGDQDALADARRRVLTDRGDDARAQRAAGLLTEALLASQQP
jgi:hypothetical protein